MNVLEVLQVCWSLEDPDVATREKEGLVAAAKEFHLPTGTLITAFDQYDEIIDGVTIHIVRLVEWVLQYRNKSDKKYHN